MKRSVHILVTVLLVMVSVPPGFAAGNEIEDNTRQFLDAYTHGNLERVLSLVDPDVTVYGSDIDEVSTGKAGVEKMFRDDMKLWNNSAVIDSMRQVSVVRKGALASIFFNASFRLAGRDPVPLRFAMVWRHSEKGWRLVQSSNVVPTEGQSAEKLLEGK